MICSTMPYATSTGANRTVDAALMAVAGRRDSTSGDNNSGGVSIGDVGRVHRSLGRLRARAAAAARRVFGRWGDEAGCTLLS